MMGDERTNRFLSKKNSLTYKKKKVGCIVHFTLGQARGGGDGGSGGGGGGGGREAEGGLQCPGAAV
jgi:hypothetical protein